MDTRTRRLLLLAGLTLALAVVSGCGGDDEAAPDEVPREERAVEQVVTVAWGEPPTLEPGLATDTTSANILHNIMEGLVTLEGDSLEPTPAVAERWEVSDDGTVYTFHLRRDARWTNGDRVTAEDFEWAWKRVLDPETAADATPLYGIAGAQAYNECVEDCPAAREEVGVTALAERTLQVTLASPLPWFEQLVAHTTFLPLHRQTVEQHGADWTEPQNIVTNGPFMLERWEHDSNIDLVRNPDWRDADSVMLERVNGRIIGDGAAAVQAFEDGEVDIVETRMPAADMARLRDTDAFQRYPVLGTYYFGFNMANVPDVHQRRAMSLAIDRQAVVANVSFAGAPARAFTPEGIPGYEAIVPESPWTPAEGDMDRAREELGRAQDPKREITLVYNDAPGHREIAAAVQEMWRELGLEVDIAAQEWARFLENLGPPPAAEIDVFRLGWIYDFPDAMDGLDLWRSDSGNNATGFANEEFDRLIQDARRTRDTEERYRMYNEAETIMFGEDGELPLIPLYHYAQVTLERETVRETARFDALTRMDFKRIVVRAASEG